MEQWKPWEKLELLKSAYYEPEVIEENKYDYSVAPTDGSSSIDHMSDFIRGVYF